MFHNDKGIVPILILYLRVHGLSREFVMCKYWLLTFGFQLKKQSAPSNKFIVLTWCRYCVVLQHVRVVQAVNRSFILIYESILLNASGWNSSQIVNKIIFSLICFIVRLVCWAKGPICIYINLKVVAQIWVYKSKVKNVTWY